MPRHSPAPPPSTRGAPHPLQPFWALAAAPLQAEALALALDSGVLDGLRQPTSAAGVAAAQGWHAANTEHWLELLWAMGVLERDGSDGDRYHLTVDAQRYLHRASPDACGAAWLFRLRSLRQPATLLRDQVAQGPELPGSQASFAQGNAEGWAAAARAQIGQESGPADEIGGGYDLVWCSSVLHFVPDAAAVLRKVFDALEPGGVFVCAHAEVPATPAAALRVLPYYTPMRLLGRHVTPQGTLEALLAQVGFTRIERREAQGFPMAPLAVLAGRKPHGGGGVA